MAQNRQTHKQKFPLLILSLIYVYQAYLIFFFQHMNKAYQIVTILLESFRINIVRVYSV